MAKRSMWRLSPEEKIYFDRLKEKCLENGKPMVLWGWKRDKIENNMRYPESRTVYFSADLIESKGQVSIDRAYFFLENRAKKEEISYLVKQTGLSRIVGNHEIRISVSGDPKFKEYSRFRMEVGTPNQFDRLAVERRLKGRPRLSIPPPRLVSESDTYDLSSYGPFALCLGSGLSAESGLPLLGEIHNLFEVDNRESGMLIFGAADNLPRRIVGSVDSEFRDFCQFTIDALRAKPSFSHQMIADLHRCGIVRQIFTDNMDDILEKVEVPYEATRLSIFPDRFPVSFDPNVKSLLVIGVAVDRRKVISQARAAGLAIIAINPVFGVAPHSRNMDYLCRGDIFFKKKAKEALPKIIDASGFGGSDV